MKKLTFGLTGSICCGKSTVARYMNAFGIPSVDADIVAREVVVPGSPGLAQVIAEFGSEHLLEDGTMNRKSIGVLVSADKDKLTRMNEIMYPIIKAESNRQIESLHASGHEIVFYDAALIIEMGNAERFRPLVVVWAPYETQVVRLMSRNSVDEETARRWIGLQLFSDEKIKHADHVIKTIGSLEDLESETLTVVDKIKKYNSVQHES